MSSRLRRGAARLEERTIRSHSAERLLASRLATRHTAREVEHRVLLGELLAALTRDERRVCAMKAEGFSAGEIARARWVARRGPSTRSTPVPRHGRGG